jgi:hypothetical protein
MATKERKEPKIRKIRIFRLDAIPVLLRPFAGAGVRAALGRQCSSVALQRAGLHGQYPSLASADLFDGDLQYKVDFRSVYAGLLETWLKTRSEAILGRKFTPLALL